MKKTVTLGFRSMLRSLLLVVLVMFGIPGIRSIAQTTLARGDLAFVSFSTAPNTDKSFSFVTWVDVAAGTHIKFTTNPFIAAGGQNAASNAYGSTSILDWSNTEGATITAGTIINIEFSTNTAPTTTRGSVSNVTNAAGVGAFTGVAPSFTNGGRALFAYQGSDYSGNGGSSGPPAVTFNGNMLFGMCWKGSSGGATVGSVSWLTTGTVNLLKSYLPTELGASSSYNLNNLPTGINSGQYTGPRTGAASLSAYQAMVANPANWTTSAASTTVDYTTFAGSAVLSATQSQTNVTCNGGSNGSATVTASGGTTPYTYTWAPAVSTTASATGLTAGSYICIITDAASGSVAKTFTITQPAALHITLGASPSVASGSTSANLPYTATTGAPTNYTITYSSAAITAGFTNVGSTALPATPIVLTVPAAAPVATYSGTVTVTKGSCSSPAAPFTVSIAGSSITTTQSQFDVSCNGADDGEATVVASGGVTPYTYSWAPSGGTAATASGLAPGTYTCTVNDAGAGTATATFTITEPTALTSSVSSQTNVACNGAATGAATVSASGGTAPYSYSWAPSGGALVTATGLAAGTYTCTITDDNSCTKAQTVTITQPSAISSSVSSTTNVSCNGLSNGAATISVSGGTPGYTYSWAPSGGTGVTATGLAAATYTVTITDANSCIKTQNATISQPSVLSSSVSSITNVSCNGLSNGAATVSASGGTPGYTYSWAPSGGTAATATGLAAGSYTVTITDANSCTKTQVATISQPSVLTSSVSSVTNVSCNGLSNGAATISASGGTPGYTYSWAPSGGTAATATGLAAGTYTVTITDANSCTKTQTVTISQPSVLTSSVSSVTNVSCNGGTNGATTVSASGGTPGYTYSWAPSGGTAATATGLAAGTYTCTITDANSCTKTQTSTISQPSAISSSVSSTTNVSCNGLSNGAATISASGGTPGYTYSWAPSGGTAATATGLAAGTYTVTITDANTCPKTQTVTISQPSALSSSVSSQTNVSCNGLSNGAATVSASGGTPGYTYSWAPGGGTAATATGLAAGSYTVTITDANSCTKDQVVVISQPSVLTSSVSSQTNVSCNGLSNGAATVSASGGTPGYTYSWAPSGGTAATATGLAAGSYTCTITDANSCIKDQVVTITEPTVLTSSVSSITNVSCNGGSTGSATVSAGGGTPSYSYSWAPSGGSAATASGLAAGSYTCTITDANSCTKTQVATITEPTAITIGTIANDGPMCAGATLNLTSTASGGTGALSYSWSGPGSFSAAVQNPSATTTTANNGTYTLAVTDAHSCTATATTTAVVNALPTVASITPSTTTICNGTALTLTAGSVTGAGTLTSYNWSGPNSYSTTTTAGSAVFTPTTTASSGVYTLTVTYPNTGCTSDPVTSASVTVNNLPTIISVSVTPTVLCAGFPITLTGNGATGTGSLVSYNWSGPASYSSTSASATQTYTVPAASASGVYSVSVTYAGTGCTSAIVSSVPVTVDPLPIVYTVSGGGGYCAGGAGLHIVTDFSSIGVDYQLYNGASAIGAPVPGANSALDFGLQTAAGTYTVVATNATTGCVSNMNGSATIVVNALPAAFAVTGGGNYCAGGAGVNISLAGSATGINYQLYNSAATVGSPVAGTGSGLSFGSYTAAGTYSMVATNATTGCTMNMTGTATITINALPNAYTVTAAEASAPAVPAYMLGSAIRMLESIINYTMALQQLAARLRARHRVLISALRLLQVSIPY